MKQESGILHYSVMTRETAELLGPAFERERPLLIDGTLGEGGHSDYLLQRFPALRIIGLDRDPGIMKIASDRLEKYSDRAAAVNCWFDEFLADPAAFGLHEAPAAVLFDFGISIYHYEASGRGFSFSRDEPLDMRLDPESGMSAEEIVNVYSREKLADLIFQYGEERYARRIAEALCRRRAIQSIRTSAELADIIRAAVPGKYRYGRIHPATRTFQALRIAVNGELGRIERALTAAVELLAPGGRIAAISFHSLEDRLVKHAFRDFSKGCTCPPEVPRCTCGGTPVLELLNRKPLRPSIEETEENPASRSARLRGGEKLTR